MAYRFVVDNEWKYDEGQPSVADPARNFNNFLLIREPEAVVGLLGNEASVPGGSMDVDRDMLEDRISCHLEKVVGCLSDKQSGMPTEGVQNLSLADANTSRQRFDEFLSTHKVYEIFPDSGKVVALDICLPIKQAFHVLYEQGIPVAPLWDSNRQQFVGMLTASDFIAVLMQIGSQRAILSEEELETHTIAAWKDEKNIITRASNAPSSAQTRSLFHVGPDDTLKEVSRRLLYHQVTTVPVLHFPAQEQSLPQLLHLASLSGVLKCLYRNFQHAAGSLPLLSQPIGSLPLGTWALERRDRLSRPLAILKGSAPLSAALRMLMQEGVSAIPIIDDNGSLLDIYARSDITALARDNTYAHVQLDQLTVEQALQLVHDGSASAGTAPVLRCQMCLRTETFLGILERLSVPGVRRIICVEAGSRRVEGIVTLTDVFRFLLS